MMMILAIILVRRVIGKELTPEQHEEARQRIQEAAKRLYTYDLDSPLLTEKQLSEFRPVNFKTMEERAQAMRQQTSALAVSKLQ